MSQFPYSPCSQLVESNFGLRHIGSMEDTLEQMARSLVESGEYRVTSRLEPQAEYHPPDNSPKLVAAVVDVETTGINPESDKIIELGICLFEYDRESGRIYKVDGSGDRAAKPGGGGQEKTEDQPHAPALTPGKMISRAVRPWVLYAYRLRDFRDPPRVPGDFLELWRPAV